MSEASAPVSVRLIVEVVCTRLEVTRTDLMSNRRSADIAGARHVAMWLAASLTDKSFPVIGRIMGRDHTTVIAAVSSVRARRADDGTYAARLDAIRSEVIARAETADRRGSPALLDADPVAIARRILDLPRGAIRVSVEEIEALASAVLADLALRQAAIRMLTSDTHQQAARHFNDLIDHVADTVEHDEQAARAADIPNQEQKEPA